MEDLDGFVEQTNYCLFFQAKNMAISRFLLLCSNLFYLKPPNLHSLRSFFFIPTTLALITSLCILFYISFTSNIFLFPHQTHLQFSYSRIEGSISKKGSLSTFSPELTSSNPSILESFKNPTLNAHSFANLSVLDFPNPVVELQKVSNFTKDVNFPGIESHGPVEFSKVSNGE